MNKLIETKNYIFKIVHTPIGNPRLNDSFFKIYTINNNNENITFIGDGELKDLFDVNFVIDLHTNKLTEEFLKTYDAVPIFYGNMIFDDEIIKFIDIDMNPSYIKSLYGILVCEKYKFNKDLAKTELRKLTNYVTKSYYDITIYKKNKTFEENEFCRLKIECPTDDVANYIINTINVIILKDDDEQITIHDLICK